MLLTSWNSVSPPSDRKIITMGKTISYSQAYVKGDWTYNYGVSQYNHYEYAWEYHRYCQLQFMYVGMTYSAAKDCAADMISKYTREFKISEWNPPAGLTPGTEDFTDIVGGNIPMAQVLIQYVDGCTYNVIVNVSEDDMRLRIHAPNDPASLFTSENARTYDD